MIHQYDKDTRLCRQLQALCEEIDDVVSLFSNASAFLNEVLEDLNWVGFYIVKNGALQLSAFQGKPACVKIAKGKGVCGSAYAKRKVQRIANVHAFKGHIACDSASNSEIVLPIIIHDEVFAVLDIDSPKYDRFQAEDEHFLRACVMIIETILTNILKNDL